MKIRTMSRAVQATWTPAAAIIVFASVAGAASIAPHASAQQQQTGLEIYSRTDPPAGWTGGPAIDGGWGYHGRGSTGNLNVPANGSLHLAFTNAHVSTSTKTFSVEIEAANQADIWDLDVGSVKGYKDNSTTAPANVTTSHKKSPHTGLIVVNATSDPQPQWEMIEITNSSGQAKSVTVNSADSTCAKKDRSTGDNGTPDSRIDFSDNMFAAEGIQPNTMRFTQISLFPRNVDLDLAVAPLFDAPDHTGDWTFEHVFTDPNGDPRPHGGVRWTTDGPGLLAGEMHDLAITMTTAADSAYVVFAFDASVGQFQEIMIDLGDVPWHEDFETHFPDVGVIDWRHWNGWDDDPAFDAPATTERARSGANAIRIGGPDAEAADVIREFSNVDHGLWSFNAWQYIPADFTSGGAGQFRGSHFLLLNTYNHGGPYHWSVDLQADSVDGVMKIYHGDDTNTINIPYVTDRWTRIQVIADLDDDWTRIYYDDDLITEYPWTGGIFGSGGDSGGGAAELRTVDLFANGSSPIFYDDLSLTPLPPTPADLLDLDIITGTILDGDLDALRASDDVHLHTRSGFGETFIDLHNVTLDVAAAAAQPAAEARTIDIIIEGRIDQPAGTERLSLRNWKTNEFDAVDTRPVGLDETIRNVDDIAADPYIRPGDDRIELRVRQTVFVPFLAFTFESFFDQIRIETR